ncbi:hypothetical protein AAFF_G00397800 [Aldrovandia affinis]|uniref:Uncharacterized protein n=1 Tax=Aldrovandia affinis TaxID=143900 RepID=A0AAD7SD44_9TELE|nr:hypothetical protein AAFF_G00397800 [Aldrovandia affinis]
MGCERYSKARSCVHEAGEGGRVRKTLMRCSRRPSCPPARLSWPEQESLESRGLPDPSPLSPSLYFCWLTKVSLLYKARQQKDEQ